MIYNNNIFKIQYSKIVNNNKLKLLLLKRNNKKCIK
jgi:hypothetical protein